MHCRVSYCECRIDLEAGESKRLLELKPSGDSVEWSGFPECLMASVFRQPVSNHLAVIGVFQDTPSEGLVD